MGTFHLPSTAMWSSFGTCSRMRERWVSFFCPEALGAAARTGLGGLELSDPGTQGALEDVEEVVVVPGAWAVDGLLLAPLGPEGDAVARRAEDVAGDVGSLVGGEVDQAGGVVRGVPLGPLGRLAGGC